MISPVFVGSLSEQVVQALSFMLWVPFTSDAMLWVCIPIFLSLIVMRLYFGVYRYEKLGWNSAISNALILIWVGVNSLRFVLDRHFFSLANEKIFISVLMLCVGVIIILVCFFHALPEGIMFAVASSFSIQFLSYLCVLFIYADMPFTPAVLVASGIIFLVLMVFFRIVGMFEPSE